MTIRLHLAFALVAASVHAGPALSQNMALTPPGHVDAAPPPRAWPEPPPRPSLLVPDTSLPNQRTGPPRPPRVVRDICIGCDR
ncbi:hypothetical protein ASG40_08920 [Methylobacterium sp. Leaf399]|uniref:hypothetical protein n=1 Tax=unclassified Methylobacterium TaxID=2615210 RepID=UPI0006FE5161|nr:MULTISPECIES: hypothetical protein [unclassified Methylobacterium]KQP55114.1 hypothetical protein ASF39_05160 [Methylobacterium sp. Leaf108]KQT09853.1 hypothetical protein ASG40_08920 [Methylobacterium sp. Leaf399]